MRTLGFFVLASVVVGVSLGAVLRLTRATSRQAVPAAYAVHEATPAAVYSIRTEPGAHGHVLTTVAFPVRIEDDVYACVVTEDEGGGPTSSPLTIAQSCDFSVSR